jgi:hypothetical protein
VRRISALYDGYWFDGGVDIFEELDLCDAGDIFVSQATSRRPSPR